MLGATGLAFLAPADTRMTRRVDERLRGSAADRLRLSLTESRAQTSSDVVRAIRTDQERR